LLKANVKKQRSVPKHVPRTWGRPVPPPCSWSPLLPSKKSSSKKTRKVKTKESMDKV